MNAGQLSMWCSSCMLVSVRLAKSAARYNVVAAAPRLIASHACSGALDKFSMCMWSLSMDLRNLQRSYHQTKLPCLWCTADDADDLISALVKRARHYKTEAERLHDKERAGGGGGHAAAAAHSSTLPHPTINWSAASWR